MADYVSGENKCGVIRIVEESRGRAVAYTCGRAVRHDGEHKDRDGAHWLGNGPILWPSEKLCGVPHLLESSDSGKCYLAAGHGGEHKNGAGRSYSTAMAAAQSAEHAPQTGGHRNVYSTATWPARPCTYIYGPNGNRCAFANGDEQHGHRTSTGLGYMHQDQWRPVQGAATVTDAPGKQSDDEIDKTVNGLRRKVRAQANQINKLEDLRRAAVDKQPEFQALKRHLDSRVAELDRDRRSERERGDRFQEELRQALVKSGSMESGRLYRLANLLGVATAGETWDTLLQRVADLKAELEVERVRANARKAELDKLNVRLTDPFDPRMFLGPSAEYGTTPLAARVAELAKRVNELEHETVRRCESWNSGTRCVGYTRHAGAHSGPGTKRWA